MSRHHDRGESRREAVRGLLRWLAAGALALLGGWLALRRRSGDGCAVRPACRGCSRLEACALPQAESARRAEAKG